MSRMCTAVTADKVFGLEEQEHGLDGIKVWPAEANASSSFYNMLLESAFIL